MPKPPALDDPPKPDRPMPPPAYRSDRVPAHAAAAHRAPQSAVFPARVNPRTIARPPSSALLRIQCQRITAKRPWQMLVDEWFSPSEEPRGLRAASRRIKASWFETAQGRLLTMRESFSCGRAMDERDGA